MSLNCKPGDLAVIVRGVGAHDARNIGRVYRLTQASKAGFDYTGVPCWEAQELDPNKFVLRDDCLKPIRDPGEHARDETLAWKPVPIRAAELGKSPAPINGDAT